MEKKTKTILIVEDVPDLLKILAERFRKEGYDIILAKNGEEGLEKALKENPDLIVLDIDLPKMDGITMLRKAREHGLETSVMLLTNLSDSEHIASAMELKAFDYLVKANWNLDEITQKIKAKLTL
jgi:two-component system response regulator VicR